MCWRMVFASFLGVPQGGGKNAFKTDLLIGETGILV